MHQERRGRRAALIVGALSGLVGLGAACQATDDSGLGGAAAEPRAGEAREALASSCVTLRRPGATGVIADAQILNGPSGRDLKNYGASLVMNAGSENGYERQTLMRFDLSAVALPTAPHTTLRIDSAVLRLAQGWVPPPGTGTVEVHRVTAPWSESAVTWQNFAGAYDPAISTTFPGAPANAAVDVSALVSGWVLGSYANHGLLLAQPGTNLTSWWSGEYFDVTARPSLDVCSSVVCQAGYADCNGDPSDGCEVLLPADTLCSGACIDGRVQSCYPGPAQTLGVGVCQAGTRTCVQGQWGACAGAVTPSAEACDGLDNDCNGTVDDGFSAVTCGVGACQRTVAACLSGAAQTCTPGAPQAETCNGIDDDCNGQVDDGLGTITCGVGACQRTVAACAGGQPQTCTPGAPQAETCNGIDDDCDGQVDEYACVVPPATVPNLNLYNYSIWDIDFDDVGNTYLTEYISGPDHLHRIDPAGTKFTYTGASNYNLGFSATTPDGSVIVGAHAWCGAGGVVVRQGGSLVTIIPTPSPCTCSAVAFDGYSVCGPADPEWGYDGWFYIGNIPAMNQVGRFKTDGTKEVMVTLPAYVISVATLPSGELFAAAGSNVYAIDKATKTYTLLAALGSQITSIATAPNTGLLYAETQARVIWEIDPTNGAKVQKLTGLTDPAIITVGPDFKLYRSRAKVDAKSTIEAYSL